MAIVPVLVLALVLAVATGVVRNLAKEHVKTCADNQLLVLAHVKK